MLWSAILSIKNYYVGTSSFCSFFFVSFRSFMLSISSFSYYFCFFWMRFTRGRFHPFRFSRRRWRYVSDYYPHSLDMLFLYLLDSWFKDLFHIVSRIWPPGQYNAWPWYFFDGPIRLIDENRFVLGSRHLVWSFNYLRELMAMFVRIFSFCFKIYILI